MLTDALLIEVDQLFSHPEAAFTDEDIQKLIKEDFALDFYRVLERHRIEVMAQKESFIESHPDRKSEIEAVYSKAFKNYISPLITLIISYIEKNFTEQDTTHFNNHSCTKEASKEPLSTLRFCLSLLTFNIITQKVENLTTRRDASTIEALMDDWMAFIEAHPTAAEYKELQAQYKRVKEKYDQINSVETAYESPTVKSVFFDLSQPDTMPSYSPQKGNSQIPKSVLKRSTTNC